MTDAELDIAVRAAEEKCGRSFKPTPPALIANDGAKWVERKRKESFIAMADKTSEVPQHV